MHELAEPAPQACDVDAGRPLQEPPGRDAPVLRAALTTQEANASSARLLVDGLINSSAYLVTLPLGLIMVPIMLKGLGPQCYGVWVLALTITGWSIAIFDAGLSWSAVREVAASACSSRRDEAARFVAMSRRLYIRLAMAGGLFIAVVGVSMSGMLRLSAADLVVAREGFVVVALSFIPSQLAAYESFLLQGLRRFDLANLLSVSAAVITALGIVGALALGFGLLAVLSVQAMVSVASAVVAYLVVTRIEPQFRRSSARPEWNLIRSRMGFSLGSQLITALNAITWEGAPLFIGPALGSAAVAQFHVGRKLPQMLTRLVWSGGSVVIPAAAGENQFASRSNVLETSTRWLFAVALPACVILEILAPNILAVWIGRVRPDTVLIFRLVTAAALLQALCTPPFNVLWGRGAVRVLLGLMIPITACNVGLMVWLLGPVGVAGAGWALFLPTLLLATLSLYLASESCGTNLVEIARSVSAGLGFPIAACAAAALVASIWIEPVHWLSLGAVCLASAITYGVLLYAFGLGLDERNLVCSTLARLFSRNSRAAIVASVRD
jgi:O-antigen/teichoic acid export membrane protein